MGEGDVGPVGAEGCGELFAARGGLAVVGQADDGDGAGGEGGGDGGEGGFDVGAVAFVFGLEDVGVFGDVVVDVDGLQGAGVRRALVVALAAVARAAPERVAEGGDVAAFDQVADGRGAPFFFVEGVARVVAVGDGDVVGG